MLTHTLLRRGVMPVQRQCSMRFRSISSLNPVIYTAATTSKGSRASGHATTAEGNVSVITGMPTQMGGSKGPEGGDTNPEQLFGMAYSTCFLSALAAAHKNLFPDAAKSLPKATEVRAKVSIGQKDGTTGFTLAVLLEIPAAPLNAAGVASSDIGKLVEAAHEMCPYSRALRGNVEVEIKVVDE